MLEIIKNIFRKRWETIYTTQDQDSYFKVKAKLLENDIEHETKFGSAVGHYRKDYTVLVRVEDAYKANQLIHEIRY